MKRIFTIFSLVMCLSIVVNAQSKSATVTDTRDEQVYKTIEIDGKTWLAQNLNFLSRNSWCYINKDENCKKYGRMYSWFSAMNGQSRVKSQGVCLKGWHIPSVDEWNSLITKYSKSKDLFVGGSSSFEMALAGCRFSNASFDFENKAAAYWTSTSDSSNADFATSMYGYSDQKSSPLKSYQTGKTYGLYLRCVKD